MSRRKTNDEYLQEIKNKNIDLEPLDEYIKSNIKILHKCNKCGYEWLIRPNDVLKGYGCPKCAGNIKKTIKQYKKELLNKNSNIECIDEYINNKTAILHRCLIHNIEFKIAPYDALRGRGCPICGSENRRNKQLFTQDEYADRIKDTNIKVLGRYDGVFNPITHQCEICGYIWDTAPNNILKGRRCPKCARNIKLSHIEFVNRMKEINDNLLIIGEYINANTKILCECKKCGKQWETTPAHLMNGTGCPKCRVSKGEMSISKFLDKRNIQYIEQYIFDECKNYKGLPFDFYLPQYNICIEYDGEQHFMPVNFGGLSQEIINERYILQKERDNIKNEFCHKNNIRLLRISYKEYKNIEHILNEELFTTQGGGV